MTFRIIQGDNRVALKTIADNSIDSIITDPPYGIYFLGKDWDANTGALETYQECLRVLKPGGHILAFSAARTYHHLAITLEQAGFEIRDQIMWIYSSGFPKSQDVGRSIERTMNKAEGKKNKIAKVIDTTKNAGFGQTDHARVRAGVEWSTPSEQVGQVEITRPEALQWEGWGTALKPAHEPIALARKPMKTSIARNCQTHGVGALNIDATRVPYENAKDKNSIDHKVPTAAWSGHTEQVGSYIKGAFEKVETNDLGRFPSNVLGEIADYQKYFYCPKVSRAERHVGFDDENLGNNHPTVKPVALMEYLIKLVTPAGGHVLDPFTGSGSTGMAAVGLGYEYTGIELDPAYVNIAETRIQAWQNRDLAKNTFTDLFEE